MSLMSMMIIGAASILNFQQHDSPSVSIEEIHKKMQSNERVVLLDVRTPQEFGGETGHLEGAILLPVQDLTMRVGELEPFKNDTIFVYCRTDNRSRAAVSILEGRAFKALFMKGGISAWRAAGLPVVLEVPE